MDYATLKTLIQNTPGISAAVNSGDDEAVSVALNELTNTRVLVSQWSRSEFIAAFAPLLDNRWAVADDKKEKWRQRNDLLSGLPVVMASAAGTKKVISDFIADGIAQTTIDQMVEDNMIPEGSPIPTPAQLVYALSSRPATRAEAAGVFGYFYMEPSILTHRDIYIALGRGV